MTRLNFRPSSQYCKVSKKLCTKNLIILCLPWNISTNSKSIVTSCTSHESHIFSSAPRCLQFLAKYVVGTTCNKAVEFIKLVASLLQACSNFSTSWEQAVRINLATSVFQQTCYMQRLLQVCYKLCVFLCVDGDSATPLRTAVFCLKSRTVVNVISRSTSLMIESSGPS